MTFEFRKPYWWALMLLALACAGTAAWLFPKALPMLQVQVDMSRDQALAAAQILQAERFPELKTDRAVARFDSGGSLQNYMELEGGGLDAYTGLLGQRFVAPYRWTVRRFSESQEDELSTSFTPEGHAYGFVRTVPEKAPGAVLAEAPAREIAHAGGRSLMGEALWAAYAPLSASQSTRTGGRIDHIFVYEHQSERRAEARFRLRLVVAGDRLVEVTPYAFVPESFAQRFKEMRAGNDTIAKVAGIAVFALLGLGGVAGGWLWLVRRGGGLAWRSALGCGAVVSVLMVSSMVSDLPLRWFGYATTESVQAFLMKYAAMAVVATVATTLLLGLVFAVAEGLTRRAFPLHPKIFSFWSVAAGASPQALGRTLGGYAWMGIELLLVVGFYLVARTQFGWWLPANSMSDPNILSAWRPALGPIANALQAGTMEEALFRAVPLAAAALIGAHLGWRRSAIAVALVLQALVFAGAHANYPGLPGYSRLVELFLPALIWGLVFLRYGLVPCIVMHFTFNLALMSMPLFVATDSRLWLDRALVLLAGLVPLLMVARARWKQGRFASMPTELRNGVVATTPSAVVSTPLPTPVDAIRSPVTVTTRPWWLQRNALLIAACVGLIGIAGWQAPRYATPVFTLDRGAAIARAEAVLAERGVQLGADWKRLAVIRSVTENDGKSVRFVWREAGPEAFFKLLDEGKIAPQRWRVMFRNTAGPVPERSEDWEVTLSGQGEVLDVVHNLPEGRPGARLSRDQAQTLVKDYMASQKALANRPWQEATVREIERPARRDWVFSYDDKSALDVKGGTVRVSIKVRGDSLDAWQYVFVPEAWHREEAQKESAKSGFKIGQGVAIVVLGLLLLGAALRQVAKGQLHWRMGLVWAALCLVTMTLTQMLTFDRAAMGFAVAQPWDTQVTTGMSMMFVGFLAVAALVGALAMGLRRDTRPSGAEVGRDLLTGLALALLLNGVTQVLQAYVPKVEPLLASAKLWESVFPFVTTVSAGLMGIAWTVAALSVGLMAVQLGRSPRWRWAMLSLAAVAVVCGVFLADSVWVGLAGVPLLILPLALFYALLARAEVGVAIVMLAWASVIDIPKALAMPVADAAWHAGLSVVVTLVVTWWALRYGRSLGAGRSKPF